MIANGYVNGDARFADRFNQPEEFFVLCLGAPAEGTVSIHDQIGGSRIQGDHFLAD
jgi:hypothetical protein